MSAKTDCSVVDCTEPRLKHTGYCREHHAAYQRAWRARKRAELLLLRAAADDPTRVPRETRVVQ